MTAPFVGKPPFQFESISGSLIMMDVSHAKLHAGNHYEYSRVDTVASGSAQEFLIIVPAGTFVHLDLDVIPSNAFDAYIYEDTAYSGGTAAVPVNNNRTSANASAVTLTYAPTPGASGTLLRHWGGTGSGGSTLSFPRNESEFIITDTSCLVQIVSGAAGNKISTRLFWYE